MKILYITAVSGTMGFFVEIIKDLVTNGQNQVDLACNCKCSLPLSETYKELGCKVYDLSCSRKLSLSSIHKTTQEIEDILQSNKYDIVHCHTPIAAMCTRIACRAFRKKGLKVIYTAHGFHFYKGAPLKNWVLYYPVEWICAHWTDVLITINKEDYALAQKHMHAKKVEYVPGVGINIEKFAYEISEEQKMKKRSELGIPVGAKLLVSVGDLNTNKNHEIVLRALAKHGDKTIHYAIAGNGGLRDYLLNLASKLAISEQFHLLGYRNDVSELYAIADLFIQPSLREGLPVAVMEAIASKTPTICSDTRGNSDLVKETALFEAKNVQQISAKIDEYLNKDNTEEVELNYRGLKEFDIGKVFEDVKTLYSPGEAVRKLK